MRWNAVEFQKIISLLLQCYAEQMLRFFDAVDMDLCISHEDSSCFLMQSAI